MVNIPRLKSLRDFLVDVVPDEQFDMTKCRSTRIEADRDLPFCGAAVCLAGWCAIKEEMTSIESMRGDIMTSTAIMRWAREHLDLTDEEANQLFLNYGLFRNDEGGEVELPAITKDMMVKELDRIVSQGFFLNFQPGGRV